MKSKLQFALTVIALVWAAVIVITSTASGSPLQLSRVLTSLGGGAAASIILLGRMITQERKGQ